MLIELGKLWRGLDERASGLMGSRSHLTKCTATQVHTNTQLPIKNQGFGIALRGCDVFADGVQEEFHFFSDHNLHALFVQGARGLQYFLKVRL
jgi:hypothetical protein